MVRVDGKGNNGSLIQARGLDKAYRRGGEEIHVLQDLNLDVDKGEFVAFRRAPHQFRRAGIRIPARRTEWKELRRMRQVHHASRGRVMRFVQQDVS